jgi:hypothetical protein
VEKLMWAKLKFFHAGISPREFRKTRTSDILEIMEIENAREEKIERERKMQEKMNKLKW